MIEIDRERRKAEVSEKSQEIYNVEGAGEGEEKRERKPHPAKSESMVTRVKIDRGTQEVYREIFRE